jgi:2-polyprenyl-3-methyl-5-hydroxy-6-metoxy-1,4-benzoquinol methylase
MRTADELLKTHRLSSGLEEMNAIAAHIRHIARNDRSLDILEAGCGRRWGLDLEGVQYTLTGVDSDKNALDIRKNQQGDLDIAILGDLRTVDLEENRYDVIFNSYVLEHVDGAEDVLNNFVRWLKPGGIMILRIPNRASVKGFITRITPLWFHVIYKGIFRDTNMRGNQAMTLFPHILTR